MKSIRNLIKTSVILVFTLSIFLFVMSCDKQKIKVEPTISLSQSSLTIETGEEIFIEAIVKNTDSDVYWTSSDENIVSIDKYSGKLHSVKAGKCIISATISDTDISASCEVTVIDSAIILPELFLNCEDLKIIFGQTFQLAVRISYNGVDVIPQSEISYKSNNPSIATVDESGVITPIAKGVTIIIVNTIYNDIKIEKIASVTIKDYIDISLTAETQQGKTFYLSDKKGDENNIENLDLCLRINDNIITDPDYENLEWHVSDDCVLLDRNNGIHIQGKYKGNAFISLSSIAAYTMTKTVSDRKSVV